MSLICIIFKTYEDIHRKLPILPTYLYLAHLLGVTPLEFHQDLWQRKLKSPYEYATWFNTDYRWLSFMTIVEIPMLPYNKNHKNIVICQNLNPFIGSWHQ